MNEFENQFYENARVLFVIEDCPKCRIWKSFIERDNTEVPISKRIKIIDLTFYIENKIRNRYLNIFKKFISEHGIFNFPILLFDGTITQGADSRETAEALIKSAFHKDFIIPKENNYYFDKKCRYENKGLLRGNALVCEDVGDEE